jgi:hypothetical protein
VSVACAPRQPLFSARTTPDKKAKFAALAASRGLCESALLTLMVDAVLDANGAPARDADRDPGAPCSERVSLRLRRGDRQRVHARAAARQMKPASYLVALIRAHVRHEAPLPVAELHALKMTVAQLCALRRLLSQLGGGDAGDALNGELVRQLHETGARVEDVRRCVSEVVRSNLMSWEAGDV